MFKRQLKAIAVMAASFVVAVVVGVILLVTVSWQLALIVFVIVAFVGGGAGFAMALLNMKKAFDDPSSMLYDMGKWGERM